MGESNHSTKSKMGTILQQSALRISLVVALLSLPIQSIIQAWSSSSMSSPTTVCAIFIALALMNWLYTDLAAAVRRKDLPPGELGPPLFGQLWWFLAAPRDLALAQLEKFGPTFTSNILELTVQTGDPDTIAWLWNAERKGQAEGFWPPTFQVLLGPSSLALQNGNFHKKLRRILQPAFAPNAIRDYTNAIDDLTGEFLATWSADKQFQSSSVFKMFALHIFFGTAFGHVDQDTMDQLHDDFGLWADGLFVLAPVRIPGTKFAKAYDARVRLLKTIGRLIEQFKVEVPPDSDRAQKTMMGRVCYAKDEDGKPLSMDCLKDNILLMAFAGHDTTYMSLGTAMMYLAKYPAIQEAIVQEVKAFKEPLDFDELKNAPVLNSFLAESWRICPPIGAGFRRLTEPMEYNGYKYPKGQLLTYNNHVASANDKLYPEPSKFSISRFLPKDHPLLDDPKLHATDIDFNSMKSEYPNFGGGNHACLGAGFAKLELRILVARMLQGFNIEVRNCKKKQLPIHGWTNEFSLTPVE